MTEFDPNTPPVETERVVKPKTALTRETKMLLVGLGMASLIGGVWFFTQQPSEPEIIANTETVTPPPPPPVEQGGGTPPDGATPPAPTDTANANSGAAPDPTGANANGAKTDGTGATPADGATPNTATAPDGQPATPDGQPNSGVPKNPAAEVPAAPLGINPDTPLASKPSRNPFKPLPQQIKKPEGGAASAPTPADMTASAPPPVPDYTPPSSPVTTTPINRPASAGSSASSGPVAIAPLPNVAGTVKPSDSMASVPPSTGAFPIPVLPGTKPPKVEPIGSSAQPTVLPPVGTNGASSQVPQITIAGVQAPSSNVDLGSALPGSGNASSTQTNAPTAPAPVTQLDNGNAGTTAIAAVSSLDQLVQNKGLAFHAVVLGPVNTAVFRSNDGFVVVPAGQKLANSNVLIKEVTATSVTLSLGNDTKTLELENR